MSTPRALADAFVAVLRDPNSTKDAAEEAAGEMFRSVVSADPIDRDDALSIVASAIEIEHPMRAGLAAITGGAIVERGGTASILLRPLIERLPDIMRTANRLYERIGEAMPPEVEGQDEEPESEHSILYCGRPVPDAISEQVAAEYPQEANAVNALTMWCLPLIACLARSADLRRQAARTDLLDLARSLEENDGNVGFLRQMLRVLDNEPLLVLHPGERAGYECRISGISSNFQLHTLLADALIREEPAPSKSGGLLAKLFGAKGQTPSTSRWLTGTRPSDAIVAVAKGNGPQKIGETSLGVWNLYNWQGLSTDGILNEDAEGRGSWIWNEGCPADIEKFDGVRTVLLGKPAYTRTWSTTRDFGGLMASLVVERTLTEVEVDERLRRISSAERPIRKQ